MFVDTTSSNASQCCNQISPCSDISLAYESFIGNNGCDSRGNGTINLGDGEWYWPVDLIYDDAQIIINGNGTNRTFLYYNDTNGIGCISHKCWLQLNNLSLITNSTNYTENKQIHIQTGGTLKFKHVLFDGYNYNKKSIWIIQDEVNVIFDTCSFVNNNITSRISNGAQVDIINCYFENNSGTKLTRDSLFLLQNQSILIMYNSIFINNYLHSSQSIFHVTSESILGLNNVIFESNYGEGQNTSSYVVNCHDCIGSLFQTNFTNNSKITAVISSNTSSLTISNSQYINNEMDYLFVPADNIEFTSFSCSSTFAFTAIKTNTFRCDSI